MAPSASNVLGSTITTSSTYSVRLAHLSDDIGDNTPRRDAIGELDPQSGDQQHGLFFHGPDGRAQIVSTEALETTFGTAGASVKLVILIACYSEVQAHALRAHVDCVVATGRPIHDDVARTLAVGFYGGLGERESVTAAYEHGHAAISLQGQRDSDRRQLIVRAGVDAGQLVLAADPR